MSWELFPGPGRGFRKSLGGDVLSISRQGGVHVFQTHQMVCLRLRVLLRGN